MTVFGIFTVIAVAAVGIARMYFDHKEAMRRIELAAKQVEERGEK